MAWTIEYDPRVEKDFRALDRAIQRQILAYMEERVAAADDPRRFGKALRYGHRGLWRYRLRDLRIICDVRAETRVIFVVAIKHRSTAYE